MYSLICPKTKSATHCLTELFPIYQNKHWTIRWHDNPFVDPSSHRICILKIVGFQYSPLKCSSDLEGTLLDSSGAVYGKSEYAWKVCVYNQERKNLHKRLRFFLFFDNIFYCMLFFAIPIKVKP